MSETLTLGETEPGETGEFAVVPPTGRLCREDGCDNPIPDGSHPARKYCDEHFQGRGGRTGRKREGNNGEKAPSSVIVNVGGKRQTGGKADQRVRDTAGGATAFMKMAAAGAGMLSGGEETSPWAKDSRVMNTNADVWGDAVGDLSRYQPWLQGVFAPVGGDNQMKALFTLVVVTAAIVVPCLDHHKMLPGEVGKMVGGVFGAAEQMAASGVADQPAA